jgi:hypothetical protein
MTILVGADTTVTSNLFGSGTAPTATWMPFVASATGTADHLNVDLQTTRGTFLLAIYASDASTQLGITNQVSSPLTGVNNVPLVANVSISSGTTYYLVYYGNNGYSQLYQDGTSTSVNIAQGTWTWPTIPSPLTDSTSSASGAIAIWASGTAGGSAPPLIYTKRTVIQTDTVIYY